MTMNFNHTQLTRWTIDALTANTKIYKIRKDLFDQLTEMTTSKAKKTATLSLSDYQALKSYLISRNDQLTDEKELAFNKVLEKIDREFPSSEPLDHKETKEKKNNGSPPSKDLIEARKKLAALEEEDRRRRAEEAEAELAHVQEQIDALAKKLGVEDEEEDGENQADPSAASSGEV